MNGRARFFFWASILVWLVDLFLLGFLAGSHLHPDGPPQRCPVAVSRVIPAFSYSPFPALPRGDCS
ncbi:conserved hypothetical protein [Frankia canadensis]|uniref:Uncharacterized protein n=1 Tax=Frankia canadensis TaxID=1836972 RepID=A0A2I2KN18_9ACTN|nr:conserved hypothetical protein [Frankia canadensis]SOU54322.1 conserved hypothetical protein [Frankia canadensis]